MGRGVWGLGSGPVGFGQGIHRGLLLKGFGSRGSAAVVSSFGCEVVAIHNAQRAPQHRNDSSPPDPWRRSSCFECLSSPSATLRCIHSRHV